MIAIIEDFGEARRITLTLDDLFEGNIEGESVLDVINSELIDYMSNEE